MRFLNKIPALYPFYARIGIIEKIDYAITVMASIVEFLYCRVIIGKKVLITSVICKRVKNKVYSVPYGKFILCLSFVDILQGFTNTERERYIKYDKLISKGDIVCDIGAHIGTHTLLMSELVGEEGHVISIEPDINNFKILSLNISQLNKKLFTLINCALADTMGHLKLYSPIGSEFSSMSYSLTRETERYKVVRTIDFKELFRSIDNKNIDLMKIDIEGAEEKLLLSEEATWKEQKVKYIVLDTHSGVNYNKIIAHMESFGYMWESSNKKYYFYLDPNKKGRSFS